jgi:Rps23 Pro-64 3,4-dihydroxylase Tpa1-like proline 4-hydroxylase
LKKFFTCIDNYIDNNTAKNFIKLYDDNLQKTYKYHDTTPLEIPLDGFGLIKRIRKDFDIKHNLDKLEIVKRGKGSFMKNHVDKGDSMAFILYLNDEFDGGETVFENETTIKPRKGRLLLFSNSIISHKVNLITKGERYVLAGWFK